MLLKNIEFPVFAIGGYKRLWAENNILYLQSESDIIYKLDNKNLAGDTLAKRRFKIPIKERYKFIATFFTVAQLIKSSKKLIIDNKGNLVKYRKDRRVNLLYRRIIKATPIENKGIMLQVQNIPTVFTVSAMVYTNQKYIGLLSIDGGYLIYEFSDIRKKDTWRKI